MNKTYYLYGTYASKVFFLFSLFIVFIASFFAGCTVSQKDHPEQTKAIFKIVNTLPEGNKKRMHSLDSAFYLIKDASIADKLFFYGFKVTFYNTTKDYKKGISYADSIMILTEKRVDNSKYALAYATALSSKGDMYLALKKYDESFLYYTKSRAVAYEKTHNSCHSPGYMYRLGNILYAQEKYRSAAAYYKSADKEDTCFANEFLRFAYHQLYLDNIGMCYSKISIWDSAMYFYDSALKYIIENGDRFPEKHDYIKTAKAVVQGNQAGVYAAHNNFAAAEPLYLQSIDATNTYDNDFTQTLRLELASLYISNQRYQRAEKILAAVDSSLQSLASEKVFLKYYRTLAGYYNTLGDKTGANNYMEKYISLKDSLQLRDEQFAAVDAGSDIESMYQKAINENLEKDNRLKTIYLFIAIAFSIISLAVFALIWRANRRASQHNRELALNNERERISKELHDDLGSGLTSLQIMVRRVMNQQYGNAQQETLRSIASVSEELTDQMSEVVWVLNNTNDTINGLLAHLRAYMADYLERTGLDIRLEFNYTCKENYTIGNTLRRNLLLIIKEVFHNVVKHAHAASFSLTASCEEKKLHLIIQDDGRGLPDNIVSKGNGLQNIQSRIGSMHGTVSFNNSNGLQVIIEVPVL